MWVMDSAVWGVVQRESTALNLTPSSTTHHPWHHYCRCVLLATEGIWFGTVMPHSVWVAMCADDRTGSVLPWWHRHGLYFWYFCHQRQHQPARVCYYCNQYLAHASLVDFSMCVSYIVECRSRAGFTCVARVISWKRHWIFAEILVLCVMQFHEIWVMGWALLQVFSDSLLLYVLRILFAQSLTRMIFWLSAIKLLLHLCCEISNASLMTDISRCPVWFFSIFKLPFVLLKFLSSRTTQLRILNCRSHASCWNHHPHKWMVMFRGTFHCRFAFDFVHFVYSITQMYRNWPNFRSEGVLEQRDEGSSSSSAVGIGVCIGLISGLFLWGITTYARYPTNSVAEDLHCLDNVWPESIRVASLSIGTIYFN